MLKKYLSFPRRLRSPSIAVARKESFSMAGSERGRTILAKSDSDSSVTPPEKKAKRIFDFKKSAIRVIDQNLFTIFFTM